MAMDSMEFWAQGRHGDSSVICTDKLLTLRYNRLVRQMYLEQGQRNKLKLFGKKGNSCHLHAVAYKNNNMEILIQI